LAGSALRECRRIDTGVLAGPRFALTRIARLLLRTLTFGRIDDRLLTVRLAREQGDCQSQANSHYSCHRSCLKRFALNWARRPFEAWIDGDSATRLVLQRKRGLLAFRSFIVKANYQR
jgi:hypothetical protein